MHILIIPSEHLVTESAPLAGVFQYEQAQALSDAGYKVGVISVGFVTLRYLFKKYSYKRRESFDNLNLFRKYKRLTLPHRYYPFKILKNKYLALFFKEFDDYIKNNGKPDVVHAHNFLYAGCIAKELKQRYGLPFILTEHSSSFARGSVPTSIDKDLTEVCNQANALTCVSSAFSTVLNKRLNFAFDVFHNIVDNSFFSLKLNDNKNKNFTFLNVASLDANKNQRLLLLVFAEQFKNQSIQLKIIGDGPLMTELITLSEKLGISPQVEFLGRLPRNEVRNQMLNAHCFVLPSNYETFGVVLIEALASGLPLIATKCGGPEDIVNQSNGILVDTENQEQLGDAMQAMVQDYYKNSLKAFNPQNLRNESLEKFGEQAFVTNAINYYKQAIEAN